MKRVETLHELKKAWRSLTRAVSRDITAGRRAVVDPVGILRDHGYELSPRMTHALLQAAG